MPTRATAEPTSSPGASAAGGAMLRAARERQGLQLDALAAAIKVAPARLEALEAGRYHELLDITFTRALAQTVCRVLKIDPVPVLAQLPGAPPDALGRVDGGLNTPFRERPGRVIPADWAPWRHPVLWLVALLLLGAAAFVLVPSTGVRESLLPAAVTGTAPATGAANGTAPAAAPAAPATGAVFPPADTASAPAAALPAAPLAAAGDRVAPARPAGQPGDALALRALQATWVQAVDGSGQTLLARLLPAGETVELTVTPPLRLRIGNASGTELRFRGQQVDLRSVARDNTVNLTLP